eukprot:TRINITY_DN4410_c0_g1_i7.p1 TRINITY_DN4410_c0_g1~~TRINITY_DN4410_c0_g1_i7.p1  ORF type:complete len:179 (-),score=18.21 TRINITY_DN4410_c0_g1_i7:196-732(-)
MPYTRAYHMARSAVALTHFPSTSSLTSSCCTTILPPRVSRISRVRASSSSSMASSAAAATTATKVLPAIIVGGGRVGRMLQRLGDGRDVLVGRGEKVASDFNGPIFVCTRNDDLEAVLESTPQSRWSGFPVVLDHNYQTGWAPILRCCVHRDANRSVPVGPGPEREPLRRRWNQTRNR